MTKQGRERRRVEAKIFSLLKEIRDIAYEYCPEDSYLTLSVHSDCLMFNNSYWKHPEYGKIDFWANNNVDRSSYFKEEEK